MAHFRGNAHAIGSVLEGDDAFDRDDTVAVSDEPRIRMNDF